MDWDRLFGALSALAALVSAGAALVALRSKKEAAESAVSAYQDAETSRRQAEAIEGIAQAQRELLDSHRANTAALEAASRQAELSARIRRRTRSQSASCLEVRNSGQAVARDLEVFIRGVPYRQSPVSEQNFSLPKELRSDSGPLEIPLYLAGFAAGAMPLPVRLSWADESSPEREWSSDLHEG